MTGKITNHARTSRETLQPYIPRAYPDVLSQPIRSRTDEVVDVDLDFTAPNKGVKRAASRLRQGGTAD